MEGNQWKQRALRHVYWESAKPRVNTNPEQTRSNVDTTLPGEGHGHKTELLSHTMEEMESWFSLHTTHSIAGGTLRLL